jgi:hypothetical protein
MDPQLTALLVGIAVTAALFALGIVVYPKLKAGQPGSIIEAAIEEALLPVIYHGICTAYRMNETSLDTLQKAISGADKKKIADSIYAMLPDRVGSFDLSLVKRIVSQQRFEQLTQDAFDRFDRFYVEHQAHFDALFEKWKKENLPAQVPVPAPAPAPASAATLPTAG